GHLAPGTSPGIQNYVDLTLAPGANFDVDLWGSDPGIDPDGYDQAVVSNSVTVTDANLNLDFGTLPFVPTAGQTYTVIDLTHATNTVTGTFASKPNGGIFVAGGNRFGIRYDAGTDNNDVVLYTLPAAAPALLYVNDDWSSLTPFTPVDGDLEQGGTQTAYVGYDAFATIQQALDAYSGYAGNIIVNGGTYDPATLAGGGNVTLRLVQDVTSGQPNVTLKTLTGDAGDSIVTRFYNAADANLIVENGSFAGVISGAGTLTKTTAGALTLGGSLNYTGAGGTTVDGGTLTLNKSGVPFPSAGSTGQFGSAHTVTVNSTATLQLNASWIMGDGLANHVVVNGGTLQFLNSDNYLGHITLTGGTITTSGSTHAWRTGNWGSGLIRVNPAATPSTIQGSLCFVGTAAAPLTVFDIADGAAANDLVVSSTVFDHSGFAGQMRLVKNGAGTMVLSGDNTFSGGVTINGGTLSVPRLSKGATAGPLGAAPGYAANLVFNGGILQYTGATSYVEANAINRPFTVQAGGGTIEIANAAATVEFDSSGGANSPVGSSGLLTLTGAGHGIMTQILGSSFTGGVLKSGTGTWTLNPGVVYNGYLPATPGTATVLTGTTLAAMDGIYGGVMNGGYIGSNRDAAVYNYTNDGSTCTFALAFFDGTYTKSVKVQLTNSGGNVVATVLAAKYWIGNFLANFDFDTTPGGITQTI
ncbi:MAG TPA: autotransporter-associated beta strand repeat-containing protein, partial [Candidatus Anammoximicrobium sp.]|nr:autotransporter-associated beta strand repeat-containing protein [Candidatus Anammoximicrobium sp.]